MILKVSGGNVTAKELREKHLNENPALKEVMRLRKVYDKTYEKYDKRIDKLVEDRDYELEYIWKSIMDEEEKVPEELKFFIPRP
tara:strand:+ start:625 stop:876 length:252 start_codon:yes stop_codon:yes gene_type:complete